MGKALKLGSDTMKVLFWGDRYAGRSVGKVQRQRARLGGDCNSWSVEGLDKDRSSVNGGGANVRGLDMMRDEGERRRILGAFYGH